MKKKTTQRLLFFGLFLVVSLYILKVNFKQNSEVLEYDYGADHEHYEEETPEEIAYEMAMDALALPKSFNFQNLKGDALEAYNTWFINAEKAGFQFSTTEELETYFKTAKQNMTMPPPEKYFYANSTLSGTWDQKYLNMSSTTAPGYSEGGFRTDGSLYDPVNEEMYIVSFAGHIYKIDESASVKWSLRNHTKSFEGDKFNGVNLPDGSFRLLNQKSNGSMEFSDDEGRTWIDANGAFFEGSANYTTVVTKQNTSKRIVAHGARRNTADGNAWYDYVYISTDYGLNYTTSALSFKSNTFDVEILKPHGSRDVYLFARRASDSKLYVYRMGENDTDFSLIHEPTTTVGALDSVLGTTVSGTTHFYISYGNTTIFYSGDEGATWTQSVTSSDTGRNIAEVHPTQPNIVFKGFVELWISTDYGVTWTRNQHVLSNNDIYVWDLQHFKTYDKEDGTFFTISGYDFGTYYSTSPEDWNSWVSVSRGNPTTMCYDAETSEKYNIVYTGNQDRGSQSFSGDNDYDKTIPIPAAREANTDVLRVTIANGGESAWYWYYFGTIGRSDVTDGGNFSTVTRTDFYGNWAATSLVPSPIDSEDAVYIPWGNALQKIIYNGSDVVREIHPFQFSGPISSFGYSKLNTNRWYVGLKSGQLMYSTDGGSSFTASSVSGGSWPQQDDSHRKRRQVIATSPIDEATVYYAGKGNNFLISVDGGQTFTSHNSGLTVERITELDASPNGQYVFASCEFDGAWVYSVQQDQWFKMEGLDVPDAVGYTDVQFIESENAVRFATYGSGVLDFVLDQDFSEIYVAPDNFTIETIDETCQGKNGQIKIDTKFRHNYNVTIGGTEYTFNELLNLPNLDPGTYDVCIGITNTTYQYCVSLKIEASDLLTGKFVSGKQGAVAVEIETGTAPYKVFVNNKQVLETYDTSFNIVANDGDVINIESKATCEGKLTKVLDASGSLKAFPNPVVDRFELHIPETTKTNVNLELYSISSGLVAKKQYPVVGGKVNVEMEAYPSGIYFIRVSDSKTPKTLKIVKQ
ncbi:T9SS type A sorting domain-containing protein [Hyunsoonleella flava]|uniref:T9SS type A sorting domain-containing protein n=2 Tax=Pseudomonadati TaxID=3379134 RepID=A0A4Q9FIJ9_9FLAO|nr:T9SS type A sorting domain-containing protein [Hyunsoonleella flava]TBN06851.1 T9SS type A sorting domain-containing protein [Hyunsoonleella flava]